MPEADPNTTMRRKIAAGQTDRGDGTPGADRGWRLALARAAQDRLRLTLEVPELTLAQVSLAEVLELPPERALIVLLQGPAEGLGLLVLAPEVLSAMIEVQTLGRVASTPLPQRKPTRTDAAMVAEVLDTAMEGLELALAEEADLIWAGGFRYASFLDDPRPLGLLLEDVSYKLLQAEVSLGGGARRGRVILALPAEGRGARPSISASAAAAQVQAGPVFAQALALQVEATEAVLDAVLARVSIPLARVLDLKVGEVLALPFASIDRLKMAGLDGRVLSEGRLGQQRGMRAIRLTSQEAAARSPTTNGQILPQPVFVETDEPQRQIA